MHTLTSLFLAILLFASPAKADPVEILSPSPSPVPVKIWSVDWNSKFQTSLHSAEDENKSSVLQSLLSVKYAVSPTLLIQGVVGGTQAIRPSLDFRIFNPEFRGFFQLVDQDKVLKFFIGPTMVLPFGSDAKDESLIFGAGVGGRVLLDLKKSKKSGFSAYYDLTFNKNFHQFETSITAEVNNQFALNHALYLEYDFNPRWNFNSTISFSSLWNYYGLISNNYSIGQELDFQATKMLSFYLAHDRGGDFLSPNGQNYSFGIFNADSSRVSVGVVVSL